MEKDSLFEALKEICDNIIIVEEKDEMEMTDDIKQEIYDSASANVKAFFDQIDERLDGCKNIDEMIKLKEISLNFLTFSLKKLVSELDDEAIRRIAHHVNDQLLSTLRER